MIYTQGLITEWVPSLNSADSIVYLPVTALLRLSNTIAFPLANFGYRDILLGSTCKIDQQQQQPIFCDK